MLKGKTVTIVFYLPDKVHVSKLAKIKIQCLIFITRKTYSDDTPYEYFIR